MRDITATALYVTEPVLEGITVTLNQEQAVLLAYFLSSTSPGVVQEVCELTHWDPNVNEINEVLYRVYAALIDIDVVRTNVSKMLGWEGTT